MPRIKRTISKKVVSKKRIQSKRKVSKKRIQSKRKVSKKRIQSKRKVSKKRIQSKPVKLVKRLRMKNGSKKSLKRKRDEESDEKQNKKTKLISEEEFSKFEKNKRLVKKMVDEDDYKYTKKLYEEGFKEGKIKVIVDLSFEESINRLQNTKSDLLIVTRIKQIFYNKKNPEDVTHSVILGKINGSFIFFDPNGVVNDESSLYYYLGGKKGLTTIQLVSKLEDEGLFPLLYSTKKGYQYFLDETRKDGYIHGGGYCMFINYFFIEWIEDLYSKNFSSKEILNKIKSVFNYTYSSNKSGIFPKDKDLGPRSKEEIDRIFK